MTDARALGEYAEVVSNSADVPRRLNSLYVEATISSVAPRQLDGVYVEAATSMIAPPRTLSHLYVEVLTPSQLILPFKGWGVPI